MNSASHGLIPGVSGPIGLLLLIVSIAVLTVCFDRCRWWLQWWRQRQSHRQRWRRLLESGPSEARDQLEDWDLEMCFGEPLLQAALLIAPLLGLIGTVIGLMQVLSSLGSQLVLPAGASLQGYGQVLMSTALGLIISLVASTGLALNQGLRHWQIGQLHRQLARQRQSAQP
ncbi:MAG: MotA/TolQ/ExbB proton channel family protein [Synechococcaceae cyanobacterium ELA263]